MNFSYTFEIFPPKGNMSTEGTYSVLDGLVSLHPDLISVTYGAGGSSQDNTVEISSGIKKKYNLCGVAHLTCVGSTRDNIKKILDRLKENDVKDILALRGDLKDENDLGEFHHASELIEFIKSQYDDFNIYAACYPEKHPEAPNINEDLKHLKYKASLGIKALISQLFYDNEIFWAWREKARAFGITVPIIAGIMPITSATQVDRAIRLSGSFMPTRFRSLVDRFGSSPAAMKQAGVIYASGLDCMMTGGLDLTIQISGISCCHQPKMGPDTLKDKLDRGMA